MSNLPNLLTFLRIAATPVLILLLKDGRYDVALFLFVAAGITDGLDGYLAKRFNWVSRLGSILDPLADKMLLVSAYVMLAWLGDIPFWLLLTIVFRDLVIVGGCLVLIALDSEQPMRPSLLSKFNTVMQITLVSALLLAGAGWLAIPLLIDLLTAVVTATTIASGCHYLWVWGFSRPQGRARDPG